MTAMRKGIAEHMRRSLDTSAHVTSAIEVDMSKVVAIRSKLKKEYQASLRRQPDLPRLRRAGGRRDAARATRGSTARSAATRSSRATTSTSASRSSSPTARASSSRSSSNAEGLNLLGMAQAIADIAERARTKKLLPGRRPGRHVHDHEPRRLRHLPRHAGDQPAAGRRSSAPTRSSSGRGSSRTSSART